MFKPKTNKTQKIDTLVGPKTRINGDVEFVGGFHLDGHIMGNVTCREPGEDTLSVAEGACIEGSVAVTNIILNGIVKGDIDAANRVELGPKAQVLGNVHYMTIESAVGAQIKGKLVHRGRSGAGPEGT